MMELCDGQLRLYSSVSESTVDWLWYPFIPMGKLTLIQGDPGCGKSTLMMSIIAAASNGGFSPDGRKIKKPIHVIYQCSEDGISDTIKPRLSAAGADCTNVAFLDEELNLISLNDESLRRAIADFNTKLLVIDPVQAYLGEADIANATGMRRVLKQLAVWASMYDCAVVLIGHLNKKQGSKDLYRSLGSIDLVAAARSVIQVERLPEDEEIRVVRQVKSSLAPKGKDLFFTIDENRRVKWLSHEKIEDMSESLSGVNGISKKAQAAELLKVLLADGPIRASELQNIYRREKISESTMVIMKKKLGIQSVKRDGVWYWQFPGRKNNQEGD